MNNINEEEIGKKIISYIFKEDLKLEIIPLGSSKEITKINDKINNRYKIELNLKSDKQQELIDQLKIIPDYIVDESYGDTIILYYLKIKFFNCSIEEIHISNDEIRLLKQYFPNTRLIIVTPFDDALYSVNIDEIVDGVKLDLKNHTLEQMYTYYNENGMKSDIFPYYRKILKIAFGIY